MGNSSENREANQIKKCTKHITIGLLAHVDAGKTTLSEGILYLSGSIRKLGRVDHGDAFFDTFALERSRGITIFSKQAVFDLGPLRVTLLDTPGHVDFSAETERTLPVLDYAVLVINGADGVQGHTRTLWSLLKRYRVPAFLFINKMDQEGADAGRILGELKEKLDEGCVIFGAVDNPSEGGIAKAENDLPDETLESAAMCDEQALEEYLESGTLERATLIRLIACRKIFPCYFGSALKLKGVQELLEGIEQYADMRSRNLKTGKEPKDNRELKNHGLSEPMPFGAKVYKISRDSQGNRLTHLKVTSSVLRVKDMLRGQRKGRFFGSDMQPDTEVWEEKVNQIRIYSGEKFELVQEAEEGTVCAVTGLNFTYPGEGLGIEKESKAPALEPVLSYQIRFPEGYDVHKMLRNLRILEEEDPMLRIVWDEKLGEIYVQLMGEIQIQVLKSLIEERFKVSVEFDTGNIVYKETISKRAEGVGHFEPLRHYAEVHLILEPGEPGSGLVVGSDCSEDMLERNWQRLILTHLCEKEHRGVLTGAAITDMKITLAAGRAHLKHTEGGDFRQATYRAVRQGLMQADSVLLEPYYSFRLEVPSETVGRALADIQRMSGEFEPPVTEGEMSVLCGSAPVAGMRDYQMEVTGYTKGRGRLFCSFQGYAPCHNAREIIESAGYDAEHDPDNPPGSVFCSHGSGFYVEWDKVPEYMHIESQLKKRMQAEEEAGRERTAVSAGAAQRSRAEASGTAGKGNKVQISWNPKEEKELEEIFIRTYGRIERKTGGAGRTVAGGEQRKHQKKEEKLREYLLVDGYNVIFAWEELKELAKINIEAARGKLMDILCNYQGFRKCTVILVFDAYKVEGCTLEIQKYHNIHIVYTKEAETADQYIEKVVHEIGRKYHVTVVTSDGVEQVVTLGQGGTLISAREFQEEIALVRREIEEESRKRRESGKNYLFDHMDKELADHMEEVRLGRKEL